MEKGQRNLGKFGHLDLFTSLIETHVTALPFSGQRRVIPKRLCDVPSQNYTPSRRGSEISFRNMDRAGCALVDVSEAYQTPETESWAVEGDSPSPAQRSHSHPPNQMEDMQVSGLIFVPSLD